MNIIDSFLGMPWTDYYVIWKTSVGMLISQYLFLTVVCYVIFIVVLAIAEGLDMLANSTIGFVIVLFLFASPICRLFGAIQIQLSSWGMQLPKFFT
jgi:hypothetical protein